MGELLRFQRPPPRVSQSLIGAAIDRACDAALELLCVRAAAPELARAASFEMVRGCFHLLEAHGLDGDGELRLMLETDAAARAATRYS